MEDREPYILGTDEEELTRLKIQHNVWKSETVKGWALAKFKLGDVILDLGSGPGSVSYTHLTLPTNREV